MTRYPGLARLAARLPVVAAPADAFAAPLRVQIAGRGGVGRTTIAALLGGGVEVPPPVDGIDTPPPVLDGDAVVYVTVGPERRSDEAVMHKVDPSRLLVVANKADIFAETIAGAVPLIASIALSIRENPCTATEFDRLATGDGDSLRDRWEVFGVARAIDAVRTGEATTPDAVTAVLRDASGVDRVRASVAALRTRAKALRGRGLLDALERLAAASAAVERDEIENYVRSPEAARIGLEAAWVDPSLAEVIGRHSLTEPVDADQALRMATWWREFAEKASDPAGRRAALRIHDGYVSHWTAMV